MRDIVEELLPQKEPFKFIDKIEEFDAENEGITCSNLYSAKDYYFEGHFPNHPIVPGVLLIETMAQSGLLLIVKLKKFSVSRGYLVKSDKVSFHDLVKPNQVLIIKTNIIKEIGDFIVIKSKILKENGKKVATGTLTLKV